MLGLNYDVVVVHQYGIVRYRLVDLASFFAFSVLQQLLIRRDTVPHPLKFLIMLNPHISQLIVDLHQRSV